MGLNAKNPLVLAGGGLLVLGTVNAFSTMATGQALLGNDDVNSQNTSASRPKINSGEWVAPASGAPGTPYGKQGPLWASGHHTGIDYEISVGTAVHAASSGTVISAGPGGKYGNQIVIRHQEHLYSQYAHLSRIEVRNGDTVRTGQEIGKSGDTGNVTGPHLHFEVRTGPDYGSDLDPGPFVRNH